MRLASPRALGALLLLLPSASACGSLLVEPEVPTFGVRSEQERRAEERRAAHRSAVRRATAGGAGSRVERTTLARLLGLDDARAPELGAASQLHRVRSGWWFAVAPEPRKSTLGTSGVFRDEDGLEFVFRDEGDGMCSVAWEADDSLDAVVALCDEADAYYLVEGLDGGGEWLRCELDAFCAACDDAWTCDLPWDAETTGACDEDTIGDCDEACDPHDARCGDPHDGWGARDDAAEPGDEIEEDPWDVPDDDPWDPEAW